MTHVLHTARISNDKRVLYNDTEKLMVRLLSHLLGSYVRHVLHTTRISNDKRVLYNVLHTAWVSNDERVLSNDMKTLMVRLPKHLLGSYVTHVLTVIKLRILRAAR